jgi:hydroxypyruvate isomerase
MMAKLSACIEPFFSELPYAERIRRVAELGFSAYEFWFHDKRFDGKGLVPEKKDFDQIAELNARYGLITADFVFNHPDGGIVASLINANDRPRLLDSIEEMIGLAKKIGCRSLISGSGNKIPGLGREKALDSMVEGLSSLAPVCRRNGITLIVEPFNSRVDHPDYFLDNPETCVEALRRVNSPNVKMLFDIYHMQIMYGNILLFVRQNLEHIGHFHVAGVPGRHEPIPSELDFAFILKQIDAMGYTGYFGLEYWPTGDAAASLTRTKNALAGP